MTNCRKKPDAALLGNRVVSSAHRVDHTVLMRGIERKLNDIIALMKRDIPPFRAYQVLRCDWRGFASTLRRSLTPGVWMPLMTPHAAAQRAARALSAAEGEAIARSMARDMRSIAYDFFSLL